MSSGVDILGKWQSTIFSYYVRNDPQTTMDCSIIVYLDLPVVRFTQVLLKTENNCIDQLLTLLFQEL
jgi:hypothetical protein